MDFANPSYFSVPTTSDEVDSNFGSKIEFPSPKSGRPWCRNKRTFLRSMSTNSADSNNSLLFKGEPRLSDIAPDLKDPPSRSSSLKADRSPFVRRNPIDLPEPFGSGDNLSIPSEDEVFVEKTCVRYHNLTFNHPNQRRHSIGTFQITPRDRTNSGASTSRAVTETSLENIDSSVKSFKDDFPFDEGDINLDLDDHSIRHASYPRKRCVKCSKGSIRNQNMDDILIVSLKSSEAASLWVDYFSSYFQQISAHANRKPFKIKYTATEDLISKLEDDVKELISSVSGVKLQLVVICPSFLEFIAEHSDSCDSLGRIFLADRTLALLLGVNDNDLTDVHKKVLPTYHQWHRQSVGQDQDETFTKEFLSQAMAILSKVWKQQISITSQTKACFSLTPKKIRQGQNSVSVLLSYPLHKEDIVKISVEKDGELIEVKNVKRRNPYVMKFWMPEHLTRVTVIVNVLVEKNGDIIGSRPIKCESKLRELDQILRSVNNPVDFMCQAIGFSPADRDNLDAWLVHNFQKNVPGKFGLLSGSHGRFIGGLNGGKYSHEEFPTLLHFAAKFGLQKLAMQLLECPGAEAAYEIRNIYDMTPLELADANGFPELAQLLKGFMNINEFSNIYSKLVEISNKENDEDGYMVPKSIQEFYKLCPAPKPVVPTPTSPENSIKWTLNQYIPMHTPRDQQIDFKHQEHHDQPNLPSPLQKDATKKQHPVETHEDKVQKELAEIINDFKNNIHSIAQAEKLVEEWKNRNDVQKSFQEKRAQLEEMRAQYEQLQNKMKSSMKKATPFERMKKLFAHKKEEKRTERPVSSLSTSSSGSSGRISTISVGDSGTLSDNDERTIISHVSEDDIRNKLSKAVLELNYSTVPAPKPLKIIQQNKPTFETIQEKPARPTTLDVQNQFYIEFPPSGLPVPGLESELSNLHLQDQAASLEYMNISAQDAHLYMNFKIPTLLNK